MFSVYFSVKGLEEELHWWLALENFKPDASFVYSIEDREYLTCGSLKDITVIENTEDLPDEKLILMAPTTAIKKKPTISLLDFVHPENAIYMFGPDNHYIPEEKFKRREPDQIVYIPVDTESDLFSYVAYALTIWHRRNG